MSVSNLNNNANCSSTTSFSDQKDHDRLAGFASLRAKLGDRAHALELLLLVLNHPASLQVTKYRASALRAYLEAQFTPTQIETIQTHAGEKPFRWLWKPYSSN